MNAPAVQEELVLPPQIDSLGEYVNTSKPEISGSAMAGKVVRVFLDGNLLEETLADKDGRFSFTVSKPIADGTHKLTALIVSGQKESDLSWPITFVVDTTDPELVIESPVEDKEVSVKLETEPFILVSGQSESGVKVVVNDRLARVKIDGSFQVKVPVEKEGDFQIKAVATDKSGNSTEVAFNVKVVKAEE